MNPSQFARKLAAITEATIRKAGVDAVQENKEVVISDAIVSNAEGLTFAGDKINKNKPFTDWEESGEFHDNLKFAGTNDIEFTSIGDGYEAIANTYPEKDWQAPTAKILSSEAKKDIRKSLINNIGL